MVINQFVTNFQTATVPQIVKRYAAKDYDNSKRLLLEMAKYSFFLMLLLAMPICFTAEQLLTLWLGVTPPFTAIFLQLIVVQSLIQTIDSSLYYAIYAKGRLRENALLSPSVLFLAFPFVYVLFKLGFSPVALSWAAIVAYMIIGLVIKPILVVRLVSYTWNDIFSVFIPCLKVALTSLLFPLLAFYAMDSIHFPILLDFLLMATICVLSVALCTWYVGLSPSMRTKLVGLVKMKFRKSGNGV